MRATAINHVSIPAVDVEELCRFYQDVLGLERIPAPNFGFPVAWLKVGALQLHLYQVAERPPHSNQHLGLEVDDFEGMFRRLKEQGVLEQGRFGGLFVLASGQVQLYFRDPEDNLVEIDHPDVATLDLDVFEGAIQQLGDMFPQDGENLQARLFLAPDRAGAPA
ncbi:MAG: VOC family protein [Thermoleophilia bacterium]